MFEEMKLKKPEAETYRFSRHREKYRIFSVLLLVKQEG